jgi:hypothetical protein
VHLRSLGAMPLKELRANEGMSSIFGEMALLAPNGRATASVAVPFGGYCDTFVLQRSKFLELTHIYPSFRRRIEAIAAEREEENREATHAIALDRTDTGPAGPAGPAAAAECSCEGRGTQLTSPSLGAAPAHGARKASRANGACKHQAAGHAAPLRV